MQGERTVAGIACGEVLAKLSDYVDGTISADDRAKIEGHVRGCDACDRFGGAFGKAVAALRRQLDPADASAPDFARLRARLDDD